jgi:hypothetical protein
LIDFLCKLFPSFFILLARFRVTQQTLNQEQPRMR